MDRKRFFHQMRNSLHPKGLRQAQVEGYGSILDAWHTRMTDSDPRWLAYMLATVFHETAGTMEPVRETRAASDAAAIVILERAYADGRLKNVKAPYWRPDANGVSWLGRGLVQLTHRGNYEKMAEITGIDLRARPERAMEMEVAITILFEGMRRGSFTGHRLDEYFSGNKADWVGARRIVNGLDRAQLIAGYGQIYCAAIAARSSKSRSAPTGRIAVG